MITFDQVQEKKTSVAVVGLGYVGLPLAVVLSRYFQVIGFDISTLRIEELKKARDCTGEVSSEDLKACSMALTSDPRELSKAGLIVVAVPTPIDKNRRPDLTPIISASEVVGRNVSKGSVVVYESTVYPGLTEEICVPLLEKHSTLTCGEDFWVGYSPERINPGDKVHTLETIVKVVAGQDEKTLELLEKVYSTIVKAGVHKASSIKVAEAAKVIENTQRDLNIALMNELALIFDRLDIDTLEVLEAAGTKWNFLPFKPGLVGGHCIGVDPYYLTFKAEALGFHPQVILAGRQINDSMGKYVAEKAIKTLIQHKCSVHGSRVGVLGLTFKENVPDLRNTRVVDIIRELSDYCLNVLVHDPLVDPAEAKRELDIDVVDLDQLIDLDLLILAVPHDRFKEMGLKQVIERLNREKAKIIFDLKGVYSPREAESLGVTYWRT